MSVNDSYNPTKATVETEETVKDVIDWCSQFNDAVGIGIDTLTKWATGKSGWRPADLWLRAKYPGVAFSIASPNSLYGSMTVGGMAVKKWFSCEKIVKYYAKLEMVLILGVLLDTPLAGATAGGISMNFSSVFEAPAEAV